MKWYQKYLAVFEKNLTEIPQSVQEEISHKLQNFISNAPLVSVVVIAHNEERRLWGCLWSLADNLCDFPVEIIGVDNLSSDHTVEIFRKSGIPPMRIRSGKREILHLYRCRHTLSPTLHPDTCPAT